MIIHGQPYHYRLRNGGYDYNQPGIYHVTLVVGHRERLLGSLNMDAKNPGVVLTYIGRLLQEQWEKTPALQAKHGNMVRLLKQVVMPNHWHGVIEIEERMSWSLGDIIQAVKAAITSRWRKMNGYEEPRWLAMKIKNMTKEERSAYYQTRPRIEQPFFDDDFDDTICLRNADGSYDDRHRSAMIHYVEDNPLRAIIMVEHSDYMQRCLHLIIDGRDYAAFGNLFLLRWSRKEQVFCHRRARLWQLNDEEKRKHGYTHDVSPEMETRVPYEETKAFEEEHDEWIRKVMDGQTVLVTPGISEGEKRMKQECLDRGLPLIHIQKEPIGQYWKPEKERFEACIKGALLILAPWNPEQLGDNNGIPSNSDYAIFHNLNDIAKSICAFEGKAIIKSKR